MTNPPVAGAGAAGAAGAAGVVALALADVAVPLFPYVLFQATALEPSAAAAVLGWTAAGEAVVVAEAVIAAEAVIVAAAGVAGVACAGWTVENEGSGQRSSVERRGARRATGSWKMAAAAAFY